METDLKKVLKTLSLETRHLFEGYFDNEERWQPGDLERRINSLGVWKDKDPIPIYEMSGLSEEDKKAREIIDGYIELRKEAGDTIETAVTEFIKESAYTWTNRIFTLRCMEARGLIDEVIIQKDVYGGRSLEHKRLVQKDPGLSSGEDDGLFVLFKKVFREQYENIPDLFDPESPAILLRPSPHVLQKYIKILSGKEKINNREFVDEEIFKAQDAMGWAYQYWNAEEKDRVFEMVRTRKGAKIEGSDIIPATQLYTEPYMVKFLVQNSLGATWMQMHPESELIDSMEYYVKDADRTPVEKKLVKEVTFLDPAVGSGHFLLEAFDIYFKMYQEEGYENTKEICDSILNSNLFGIDIDERSIQITRSVLYMKAAEKVYNYSGKDLDTYHDHIVATNIHLPKGKDHLEIFLEKHPEDAPLKDALIAVFEGLENVHELGSLVQIEEVVEKELERIKEKSSSRIFNISTGELITPINYHRWRNETLIRIKQHFQEEVKRANISESFFSKSIIQGLEFFNLISRRYDIVTANPPYMGSGNMGYYQKKYIEKYYKEGKRDLYSAFIMRNCQLSVNYGKIAMVTQQSWMFLTSFKNFRIMDDEIKIKSNQGSFKGILKDVSIETIAHLGPRAFSEISGEVVNIVLFVFSNIEVNDNHVISALRLIGPRNPIEKEKLLLKILSVDFSSQNIVEEDSLLTQPKQVIFQNIPNSPICYWLRDKFLNLLSGPNIGSIAEVRQGLVSGDDQRTLRYFWETPMFSLNWKNYTKGGGYARWDGFNIFCINYSESGNKIKYGKNPRFQNSDWYFKPGLWYSRVASNFLGARVLTDEEIIGVNGPGIFMKDHETKMDIFDIWIVLNARFSTFIARSISQSLVFQVDHVSRIPIVNNKIINSKFLGNACLILKRKNLCFLPMERMFELDEFIIPSQKQSIYGMIHNNLLFSALLSLFEGYIEKIVYENYNLSHKDIDSINSETGVPSCEYPLITFYDQIPKNQDIISSIPDDILNELTNHKRISYNIVTILEIKNKIQKYFTFGPGVKEKYIGTMNPIQEEENQSSNCLPFPSDSLLDEISHLIKLHPLSIYWILKEGIEEKNWRCPPEEERIIKDQLSVIILQYLGFTWPNQRNSEYNKPHWVDEDGIIPIIEGCSEESLTIRIKSNMSREFNQNSFKEFEKYIIEVLGISLDEWVETEFFNHHIKQFKKRPIAWQLQSSQYTRQRKPAFSCLMLFHKIDEDVLFKIRSHYIGPLRVRYETELRMIEELKPNSRSERQSNRRDKLIDLIHELKEFDEKIAEVSSDGFQSKKLEKIVEKETLDEWCSMDGKKQHPPFPDEFYRQEKAYIPDINDGVRVNIAPLQKAGLLAADVLAKKDLDKAISDRAEWRADERRWCREGKLPKPGWWVEEEEEI